jgi:hypothetical protein
MNNTIIATIFLALMVASGLSATALVFQLPWEQAQGVDAGVTPGPGFENLRGRR